MAASNNQVGPNVNAKTIAFDRPGAGVIGYGVNADNLYKKLGQLYGQRTNKAGGSRSIWDAMVKNTAKSWERSQSPITREFQNFLNTGKLPTNQDPRFQQRFQKYAAESLDYGLRETGRQQQHKPVNFFTEYLMDPLIQAGLGMIPGVGVPLAMAYGGIKGVVDDGIMGGLTGLASGYGAGTFGSTIGNTVASTGGLAASAANPGTFGRNLLSNLNPFSGAGSTVNNHFANNAGGFFSGGGAFGGTAGRGVANAGTAINAAGRTSGTGFSGFGPVTSGFGSGAGGAVASAAGAGGSTGGKMGALSNFMPKVTGFVNNFDYGSGNLLGDAIQGGLSYFGNQQASNQLNNAADRAFANSQFQPYNINTPGGSATFNGQNASATLSPEAQRLLGDYNTTMGQSLTAFNKFSPQKHSQEMYRTLSNLRAPGITQQNNNLLSDVYNRGQWGGTVGAQEIYSADMANNLQDQVLRMQSQEAGGKESDRLFNNYMKSAAAYHGLLNSPNEFITAGLQGGQARSSANSNANQYPWLAAGADYGSSNAFWSSIGQSLNNMSQQSANNSANSNAIRNNYQNNFQNFDALGLPRV